MSTYEQDREDSAVGPEICEECWHPLRLHGSDGCQFERGDRWVDGESMGAWMAGGPCGCSATTIEPEPPAFPSPLLAKHKLEISWEEL